MFNYMTADYDEIIEHFCKKQKSEVGDPLTRHAFNVKAGFKPLDEGRVNTAELIHA